MAIGYKQPMDRTADGLRMATYGTNQGRTIELRGRFRTVQAQRQSLRCLSREHP